MEMAVSLRPAVFSCKVQVHGRSPQGVWVAVDPESKLLLTIDIGEQTLAMAQRFVHHGTQVLAPNCAQPGPQPYRLRAAEAAARVAEAGFLTSRT
jgi:hypothetical protein